MGTVAHTERVTRTRQASGQLMACRSERQTNAMAAILKLTKIQLRQPMGTCLKNNSDKISSRSDLKRLSLGLFDEYNNNMIGDMR